LSVGGAILVCYPLRNPGLAEWHRVYQRARAKWHRGNILELTWLTAPQFFQDTNFAMVKQVSADGEKQIELEHLIYRSLATPTTSRAILGDEADEMLAEVRAAVAPYFRNGPIMERHRTMGYIYRRRLARNPEDLTSWGRVGRNEKCPCGSGKKFKHCHGRCQTAS
jgi:hypothetical protein